MFLGDISLDLTYLDQATFFYNEGRIFADYT